MVIFPKKYDYKKSTKKQTNTNWQKIQSPSIPMDQKINPWVIFSHYYGDLFALRNNISWTSHTLDYGFWLSSQYYSDLSKWKNKSGIAKIISKNYKFLDKLWIDTVDLEWNQLCTEDFNIYLRNIFGEIYEKRIFVKKETTFRSQNLQADVQNINIKKTEKDIIEYTLKYFVESKWYAITLSTTDINTIFGDVAVAVNPIDKRYKKLIWQNVIIPIINKSIPIIADESVDIFKWTGVQRVTPWHDEWSLSVAEKHHLPTDVYAIDTDWTFSENAGMFSGKSLEDFSDNIDKYIDDIWNLSSKRIIKWYEYSNKYTWEILYPMTLAQWNISYDYSIDYLHELIEEDKIVVNEKYKPLLLELLDTKQNENISSKSGLWLLIPVCYDADGNGFPLSDEIIYAEYLKQKSKKNLLLTLIVFNLIADNSLPHTFSISEIIDVLYTKDFLWDEIKIEKYMDIYDKKAQDNSIYKNDIKKLKKIIENFDKDAENVDSLADFLRDSFAICNDGENFWINYSDIFQYEWELQMQTCDSFNKIFIDVIGFAYKNQLKFFDWPYSQILSLENTFIWSIDDISLLLDVLLFGIEYSRTLLFSHVVFHPSMVDVKWDIITNFNSKYLTQDLYENFNLYGADTLRLTLLLGKNFEDTKNIVFDTYPMRDYHTILNKIWNANRYVYSKFIEDGKTIKISNLIKAVNKEISSCDVWILHNIKSFLWDLNYLLVNQEYLSLGRNIFKFYQNIICEKYLQATKVSFSTNTQNVILLVFAIFNKLIEPYVPNFAWQLQSKLDFDREWYSISNFDDVELMDRNYKINVFMDIVDNLINLKHSVNIAQHENIDMFVQANPEFLDFIQENDLLLRALIKIWQVDYIWDSIDMPSWYTVWNVININLWIKKSQATELTDKWILKVLMQDFEEKSEYLKHLKWLLASAYATCPPEILAQKKEKIRELQAELDDLEYKIWLLKTKV